MKFNVTIPMLGFENVKEYTLEKIDDIFMRLESTDTKEPSFTLINPFILKEYDFDIPTNIQESMQINDTSNILIFTTISINSDNKKSIINFLAPVVFNTDNHMMAQVLLEDTQKYTIEPISNFLEKKTHS